MWCSHFLAVVLLVNSERRITVSGVLWLYMTAVFFFKYSFYLFIFLKTPTLLLNADADEATSITDCFASRCCDYAVLPTRSLWLLNGGLTCWFWPNVCVYIYVCVGGGGLLSALCCVGGVRSQSAQAWRSELLDRVQSFAEQPVLCAGNGAQTDTLQ